MKKLKLEVEALVVDSFATAGEAAVGGGTVAGWEARPTLPGVCDHTLLATNPTCCPCTPAY